MKKIGRRNFLASASLAAGSLTMVGCNGKERENHAIDERAKENNIQEEDLNVTMSRESILSMLDQRVIRIMDKSHHCAQTAFLALKEQFNLNDGAIMKALTPLPGLAEKGMTCGAVTGCLMAMGLVFGRSRLEDWKTYRESLKPTGEFVSKFIESEGSTDCGDILVKEFGKRYDLLNPTDHTEYVQAGATEHCSKVVQRAVREAAEIILRENYNK